MDILPTVLDLADIPLPKNVFLDGESLKPFLIDEKEWER